MVALQTLDPTADTDTILTAVRRDGAAIIRDALDADVLNQFLGEAMPFIERTPAGRHVSPPLLRDAGTPDGSCRRSCSSRRSHGQRKSVTTQKSEVRGQKSEVKQSASKSERQKDIKSSRRDKILTVSSTENQT